MADDAAVDITTTPELEGYAMTTDDLRELTPTNDDADSSYVAGGMTLFLLGC